MKTIDLFNYFGGRKKAIPIIAKMLDVHQIGIYYWGELVPMRAAAKIEVFTKGKLKLNAKDYADDVKGKTRKVSSK